MSRCTGTGVAVGLRLDLIRHVSGCIRRGSSPEVRRLRMKTAHKLMAFLTAGVLALQVGGCAVTDILGGVLGG